MVSGMHSTAPALASATGDTAISYSVRNAAPLIGVSERRMWDLVKEGKVRSFMDGGRRLVSRRALEEYVAAKDVEAA